MSKLADEIAAHAASTAPAVYTPFVSGRYEVKPGLKRFGSDFGNGAADQRVFQLDFDWPRYRAAKEAARAAGQRCFVTHEYPADVDAAARGFMIERLSREYPGISVPCDSTVDEMAMLLQEDIAVTMMRGGRQWLAMLHVCLPSHWDPRKKIGRTFSAVHEIVPGMHSVNQREGDFVRQMIDATDGLVRFVWGVAMGR